MSWYAIEDLRIRHQPVRVHWAGYEFVALYDRVDGVRRWYKIVEGRRMALPPKGKEETWGDGPSRWQPVDPATFPGPLPAPLRTAVEEGRMVDISQRSRRALSNEPEPADEGQWWLVAGNVTYAHKGNVTERDAEARIMRAILTDGITSFARRDFAGTAGVIAELGGVHPDDPADAVMDLAPKFKPTPRDESDHPIAMAWFAALNPVELRHKRREPGSYNQEQKILIWRALNPPYSWGSIANHLRKSKTGTVQAYKRSIERIHRAANGKRVFGHVTVLDQVALTREENRRARLRG